jgi:hypothetical protein
MIHASGRSGINWRARECTAPRNIQLLRAFWQEKSRPHYQESQPQVLKPLAIAVIGALTLSVAGARPGMKKSPEKEPRAR